MEIMTPGMLATVSHTEDSGDEISIEAKVKRYCMEMVRKRKEREREWRETQSYLSPRLQLTLILVPSQLFHDFVVNQ